MTCKVDGCGKAVLQRGYCRGHYMRWWRHGDPLGGRQPKPAICQQPDCSEPVWARERCRSHYYELWKDARVSCEVPGCELPANSKKLCPRHYQRLQKYGSPTSGPPFRRHRGTGLPKRFYEKRRASKKAGADSHTAEYVTILLMDPCCYCGATMQHIDHIDPLARSEHVWFNLTAACARCNQRKQTRSLLSFLAVSA